MERLTDKERVGTGPCESGADERIGTGDSGAGGEIGANRIGSTGSEKSGSGPCEAGADGTGDMGSGNPAGAPDGTTTAGINQTGTNPAGTLRIETGDVRSDEPTAGFPAGTALAVIAGRVEHGRRLGRTLGFPTANLAVPDGVGAGDGVYASAAEVEGVTYRAMSNLGRNPSVGGSERRLETHLFGFSGSLYGRELRVGLLRKIRDEKKFATVAELRAQIERDKEYILKMK